MKKIFIPLSLFILIFSCTKITDNNKLSVLTGNGVFIVNEGNYRWGNGSLSFFSYDSSKIYNDIFTSTNERPLGDIPNSIMINGDKLYIVVNNSGKIEVIDSNTLESIKTITGLIAPRNIAAVSGSRAYVTSIYSDSLIVLNLINDSVEGFINLRRSSEAIVVSENKAFISNWVGGKEVMIVNTLTNKVIDSVEVAGEPESMVLDKNKMLWVLCNGGWLRNVYAELIKINTSNDGIVSRYQFPAKENSPTCLQIDGRGEVLYYLDAGVRKMNIEAPGLPANPLIAESGHYFYKLGVNPVNSDIFVTDAVDYQQQGYVLYFNKNGTLIDTYMAGIIPGMICFRLNDNYYSE
jgi:hypothetical protein